MTEHIDFKSLSAPKIESFLISVLTCYPDKFDDLEDLDFKIVPEDFFREAHRIIFATLTKMHENGEGIDVALLVRRLESENLINKFGSELNVSEIVQSDATKSCAKTYAETIKKLSIRRQTRDIAQLAANRCKDEEDDIENIRNWLVDTMLNGESTSKNKCFTLTESLNSAYDKLFNKDDNSLKSGFRFFDNITGGFSPGQLVIIGGRPSMGKTSFALSIVNNLILAGKKVLFFSLETPRDDLIGNMLVLNAGFSRYNLQNHIPQVDKAADKLLKIGDNLLINDNATQTPQSLLNTIRREVKKHEVDIVFIDHLNLLRAGNDDKFSNSRYAEITFISRKLKEIAMSQNVPIVCLTQLSRAPETRNDKRPLLADLRESGSIEQDADIVILLYRDSYYTQDPDDNSVELRVAKNRHGATEMISFDFEKQTFRFTEMPFSSTAISEDKIPV